MKLDVMFKKMHAWQDLQNQLCLEIHSEIKKLVGNTHMIVLDKPIKTWGDYGEFRELAVCKGILMAHNANGWCDKPVQPYAGHHDYFMEINCALETGKYHLEDNPIQNDNITICC
jgi:hypothetical protein